MLGSSVAVTADRGVGSSRVRDACRCALLSDQFTVDKQLVNIICIIENVGNMSPTGRDNVHRRVQFDPCRAVINEAGDTSGRCVVCAERDVITKADHFAACGINRTEIHPRGERYILRVAIQTVDLHVVAVTIQVQHFATRSADVGDVGVTDQRSVVRRARRRIIRVAAFKRVMSSQVSRNGRRHVQRDAAVEIGVGRESHYLQCRVDRRLGAVEDKAAGAIGTFDNRDAGQSRQVQHAIVDGQRNLQRRFGSGERIADRHRVGVGNVERQHFVFVDRLSTGNDLSRFDAVFDLDRDRFLVRLAE
ncbi:hypothetical protein Pla100_60540 [Neorhodopirellula pilleata]|uniref:Uncharacterized protein n=1 Tax=Neorhodopirellula pilleata TaxID=2714738 RepID=A0A5C5ZG80_9BACT|nr:hypothetical protein Pla100_60540 [Neorhodopirellula pilleata]